MFQHIVSMPPVLASGKFLNITLAALAAEKNLLTCSQAAVESCGGPITKQVWDQIKKQYDVPLQRALRAHLEPVFHVAVSPMLCGQYAEVPGWHCDGVPYNRYHGQPDFTLVPAEAFNVSLTLSTEMMGVASYEYVGSVIKPRIWDEKHVFKDLHREVNRVAPNIISPRDGEFVFYSPRTITRARPCTRRGYQYHFRMSMFEKPTYLNQIGGVRCVYQLSEENGWT